MSVCVCVITDHIIVAVKTVMSYPVSVNQTLTFQEYETNEQLIIKTHFCFSRLNIYYYSLIRQKYFLFDLSIT